MFYGVTLLSYPKSICNSDILQYNIHTHTTITAEKFNSTILAAINTEAMTTYYAYWVLLHKDKDNALTLVLHIRCRWGTCSYTYIYMYMCVAHLIEGFLHRWVNAQVDHGVGEGATHVELHWDIVATLQTVSIKVKKITGKPPLHW